MSENWDGGQQPPPPPPPPPPPQYPPAGYPPPGYYPQAPGTNGLAIASLVLGIIWIYWIGSILALIFGYVAKSQIRENHQSGAGMATAGIVLGWIGVATLVITVIIVVVANNS